MKTAVEWFIEKIAEDYPEIPKAYREEYQKAKAMEKEQITKAYNSAIPFKFGEQYYNQTYNQNKS
jgi:hypothetical protein